ncbi:MAG: transporter [Bacteroidales bacterium]|jgi:BASS family bile acid:Na+ symporter|nr:transporter [Bacteroidales bacterium]
MQKYRSYVLPVAIVLGLFFHHFFAQMNAVVPYLIAIMLFFTYTNVDLKSMHISAFHLWLLLFQVAGSLLCYLLIRPFNEIIAQGILVTILTPTATAAVVVAVMLGANLATMATYNLLCNLIIALVAPLYFSFIGIHQDHDFWHSFLLIMRKMAPLLFVPFLLAILLRVTLPKINSFIVRRCGDITFYLWAIALIVVVGRTINYIFTQTGNMHTLIVMAISAVILCVIQFALGRYIGRRYHDVVAGGQALGQKNTVLAIWIAQTYLFPLSSVLPAIYVVWQNLYNSYQLYKKNRKEEKKKN